MTAGDGAVAGLDVRIAQELIDQARARGVSLVGPGGLLSHVTRTVLQTALEAEMTDHLGYEKGDPAGRGRADHRNGSSPKTVQTEIGPVQLEIPRDRAGGFEPQIVPKHPRRVEGLDEAIISLYAKGLTTGEIQAHLADVYQVEVSRDLISRVTDKVVEELVAWQSRPLDRIYPTTAEQIEGPRTAVMAAPTVGRMPQTTKRALASPTDLARSRKRPATANLTRKGLGGSLGVAGRGGHHQ